MATHDRIQTLVDAAKIEFGADFDGTGLGVDSEFFRAVASGMTVSYTPNNGALRANRIEWLCTLPNAHDLIHHHGIQVNGASISGLLDLSDVHLDRRLILTDCRFNDHIALTRATFREISLANSSCKSLIADYLRVEGGFWLNQGFAVTEGISLHNASIRGNMSCTGAKISSVSSCAVNADSIVIGGTLHLNEGFTSRGEVRLLGASIGGELSCSGATMENPSGPAFSADGMTVGGNVFLDRFTALGTVRLCATKIGGQISCGCSRFQALTGPIPATGTTEHFVALNLEGTDLDGQLLLSPQFQCEGEIRALQAKIGRQVVCRGAKMKNSIGPAFTADGITVNGGMLLDNGFEAHGEVRLLHATIKGPLQCSNATFRNATGPSLSADGIVVDGGMFLDDGFSALGEVRLPEATIKGQFVFKGTISNPNGVALNATGIQVSQHLQFITPSTCVGRIDLNLAKVHGGAVLWGLQIGKDFKLNLRNAYFHVLDDRATNWPIRGSLNLNGLAYDYLAASAPFTARERIDWLNRDTNSPFNPQPYEHLASVLSKQGHRSEARAVRVEKERLLHSAVSSTKWMQRILGWVWGHFTDFGHRPWKIWRYCLIIWILGIAIFEVSYRNSWIIPVRAAPKHEYFFNESESFANYPTFQSVIYSLDVFVPLVNLDQSDYWQPSAFRSSPHYLVGRYFVSWSGAVIAWYDLEVVMGWFFSTLLVAGLTSMIRRDD